MKKYLKETFFCDVFHPEVQTKAEELRQSTKKETAIAVWDFITTIPYRFDMWAVKASETLEKGFGMCTNKANLQIALLRANQIPAAYGIMKIKKEALKSVTKPDFYAKINPITIHIFAYVYLGGKWVATDATPFRKIKLDEKDFEDIRFTEWDGVTDFKKHPDYVISEKSKEADIDKKLKIKPRFLTPELLKEAREHIDQLEKKG